MKLLENKKLEIFSFSPILALRILDNFIISTNAKFPFIVIKNLKSCEHKEHKKW